MHEYMFLEYLNYIQKLYLSTQSEDKKGQNV